MECDLKRIILSKQSLTMDHAKYFVYQILCALQYLHSMNVTHGQLKPENCLVNRNCDLKICNIRNISEDDVENDSNSMSNYWYTAPEVIVCAYQYTSAVDVWATACIFGAVVNRKELFPSMESISHLNMVIDVVGRPDESKLGYCSQQAKKWLLQRPLRPPKPIEIVFPNYPHEYEAYNFMMAMLNMDPYDRVTACDALKHPFLEEWSGSGDESRAGNKFQFSEKDYGTEEAMWLKLRSEVKSFNDDMDVHIEMPDDGLVMHK